MVEIDLAFLLVVQYAPRTDFPQWRRTARADAAAGRHGVVQLQVTPFAAPHLGRGHLQLFVQHHAGRLQNTLGQVRREIGLCADDHGCSGLVRQADWSFDRQAIRALVIDDARRGQAAALIENLDRAIGDKAIIACDFKLVRDQRRIFLCRKPAGCGGRQQQRKGQGQANGAEAHVSHPPDAIANRWPSSRQPRAVPMPPAGPESARFRQGPARSCAERRLQTR